MKGTHDFIPVEAMQCSGAKDIRMEHLAKVQIPFSAVSDLGKLLSLSVLWSSYL